LRDFAVGVLLAGPALERFRADAVGILLFADADVGSAGKVPQIALDLTGRARKRANAEASVRGDAATKQAVFLRITAITRNPWSADALSERRVRPLPTAKVRGAARLVAIEEANVRILGFVDLREASLAVLACVVVSPAEIAQGLHAVQVIGERPTRHRWQERTDDRSRTERAPRIRATFVLHDAGVARHVGAG
jgi:hypothetical protein